MPPSDVIDQTEPAPSDPDDDDLQDRGSTEWWAAEEVPRNPVNLLQHPNWLNTFQDQPSLLQTLQSWFHQEMVETFSSGVLEAATGIHTMDTDQLIWMLGASFQNPRAPSPAASQGGSPSPDPAPSGSPASYSTDEIPGTSSASLAGGPSSHPSAPIAIPVEQEEPQQEPGESVPGPSTSSRGREHPWAATATLKEEDWQVQGLSSQQEASTMSLTLEGASGNGHTRTGPSTGSCASPQGLPAPHHPYSLIK